MTASCPLSPNEESCRRQCQYYHGRFPTIPKMTSQELYNLMQEENQDKTILLVDVRTRPERNVSMIPGAVALEDLPGRLPPPSTSTDGTNENLHIVTYCTIGYRSSLEARRLQQLYPAYQDSIYSLDGILAYTHLVNNNNNNNNTSTTTTVDENTAANINTNNNNNNTLQDATTTTKENNVHIHIPPPPPPPSLIHPETQKSTNQVHTFGIMWKSCAPQDCDTHLFGMTLLPRMAQVGCLVILRNLQHWGHVLRSSSSIIGCCRRREEDAKDGSPHSPPPLQQVSGLSSSKGGKMD